MAMAPYHTVCLTEHGKVVTMGRNIEAQLGRGHTEFNTGASKPQVLLATVERRFKRRRYKRKVNLREFFWATDKFHKIKSQFKRKSI